jgi:hypothetical protein
MGRRCPFDLQRHDSGSKTPVTGGFLRGLIVLIGFFAVPVALMALYSQVPALWRAVAPGWAIFPLVVLSLGLLGGRAFVGTTRTAE